jgi:fumarate reductase subunit D
MRLVIALMASATIVLASPFMGQLQSFLRRSLSTKNYVLLFGAGVLVAVGLAILTAFLRIRERRANRFALLLVALVFGGSYMWATATPWPEVNAVERVHFVEYGLIAFLFYRASLPRRSLGEGGVGAGDLSIVVLPLLAGFIVGTLDEWLQWFIPVRVGEYHDVFLNVVSILCGILFALALIPPASFALRLSAASVKRTGVVAALAWIVFATFFSQVHLGYAIDEQGIGRFRSHYTPATLAGLQADRAARWKADPPLELRRLSQEDQYLDEGLWHVRRRNVSEGAEAWRENLILERYFAPVLDTPTYASPQRNRWPVEQRADLEARFGVTPIEFVSAAEPYPIVTWPKTAFWIFAAIIAAALVAVPRLLRIGRSQ